ncbi:methyltransferase domain-containing protein [Uliginosibacterium sp. sgz301328]|uniref:methyltransferase domain-containing protein n=1 Tax=Uliginosibacterium sp. sgz301328 TaxID=3243764 RepID=UPI00359CD207
MSQWNAADYARNSKGQERWGRELIEQLGVRDDDDVLDIGCGDGRLTAAIAERTSGSVVGVDSSLDMVRHANAHHASGRLRYEHGDAAALAFDGAFSLIFSNAALHWVAGCHSPVVDGIARAMRPGARALLQMGGEGNGAGIIAAFDEVRSRPEWAAHFEGFVFPYGFHTPALYQRWAERAGLKIEEAQIIAKDMTYDSHESFIGWLRTAWLPFVEPVPAADRDAYLEAVADVYLAANPVDGEGIVHVDMRRLQVRLSKPA